MSEISPRPTRCRSKPAVREDADESLDDGLRARSELNHTRNA